MSCTYLRLDHRSRFDLEGLLLLYCKVHSEGTFAFSLAFSKCGNFSDSTFGRAVWASKELPLISIRLRGFSWRLCKTSLPQIVCVCSPYDAHAKPKYYYTCQTCLLISHISSLNSVWSWNIGMWVRASISYLYRGEVAHGASTNLYKLDHKHH